MITAFGPEGVLAAAAGAPSAEQIVEAATGVLGRELGRDIDPAEWYERMMAVAGEIDAEDRLGVLAIIRAELQEGKTDRGVSAETRQFLHERWAKIPGIIADARRDIEREARAKDLRQRAARQASPDRRNPDVRPTLSTRSPVSVVGSPASARRSVPRQDVGGIRSLRAGIIADPRRDADVAQLRGQLDATQDMLRDLQAVDAGTRRDTIRALQSLDASAHRQIVKDRQLDPGEISAVARNIAGRPVVRELLRRGMVRPDDLVSEQYAAQLQSRADSARKLPTRRASDRPILTRESVPSRTTSGLTYYRRPTSAGLNQHPLIIFAGSAK